VLRGFFLLRFLAGLQLLLDFPVGQGLVVLFPRCKLALVGLAFRLRFRLRRSIAASLSGLEL
jgi:hypothetical protein